MEKTFYYTLSSDSLVHHGVKGQEWGHRRYQNKDGSLTDEGRQHWGIGQKLRAFNESRRAKNINKLKTKKSKNEVKLKAAELKMKKAEYKFRQKAGKKIKTAFGYSKWKERYNRELTKVSKLQYKDMKLDKKIGRKSAKFQKKYGQKRFDELVHSDSGWYMTAVGAEYYGTLLA